jgi:hypothetical protein
VNVHEEKAWRLLIELGARELTLGGKHALDLRPIRATSEKTLRLLVQGVLQVVGNSGANRRHVDRAGIPIYVVTDYYTVDRPNDRDRHEPERVALLARRSAQKTDE